MVNPALTTGVPKLSLAMHTFSISIDEHVPQKFLMTKTLRKTTKICLPISIIIMVFEMNIH